MSKLDKCFFASWDLAFKRPLAIVSPSVNLQVGQLAKHLVAGIAPVLQLVILLPQRVGKGLVASVEASRAVH